MVPMFALTMAPWAELSGTVTLRSRSVTLPGRPADEVERARRGVIADSMSETGLVGKFWRLQAGRRICPLLVMLNLFQHPSSGSTRSAPVNAAARLAWLATDGSALGGEMDPERSSG